MPFTKEEQKEYRKKFTSVPVRKKTHHKTKLKALKARQTLINFVDAALNEKE